MMLGSGWVLFGTPPCCGGAEGYGVMPKRGFMCGGGAVWGTPMTWRCRGLRGDATEGRLGGVVLFGAPP